MIKLVWIAAGGGAGAVLRYLLAGAIQKFSGPSFPIGTLVVNVVGCLVIGLMTAAFAGPYLLRDEYKLALLVGLLGGFTTFSTFGWETFALANDGQFRQAALNVVLSNVLGFCAVWFGYRIGEKWLGV